MTPRMLLKEFIDLFCEEQGQKILKFQIGFKDLKLGRSSVKRFIYADNEKASVIRSG
jgi:hypothetical protein